MKIRAFCFIAVLVGTLAVIGCGDSSSSNGGGNGVDADAECNVGACAVDSDEGRAFKAACVSEINGCLELGVSTEAQCIAFGVETCNA